MAPTYPSAEALQAILDKIKHYTGTYDTQQRSRVQVRLDPQQSDDQVVQKEAEAEQARYSRERGISDRYDMWWKSRWGKLPEPGLLSRHLDALVHTGDPYTLPSADDIVLAFEVVWLYQEDALALPLVREVMKFLRLLGMEVRLSPTQHTGARTLLQELFGMIIPKFDKRGPYSYDISALVWQRAILADYERWLATVQTIFRHRRDYLGRVHALQKAFPDVPGDKFSDWARYTCADIARAMVAYTYNSTAETIRKVLQRARIDRKRRHALQTRPQEVDPAIRAQLIHRWQREKTGRNSS
jgi:hypothetical protein